MNKYPNQLYVTLKAERSFVYEVNPLTGVIDRNSTGNWVDDIELLGFANEYAPNSKAFTKKKNTACEWAYGGMYEERNGVIWSSPGFIWENNRHTLVPREAVPFNLQPRIIENLPLNGFAVLGFVSRQKTSNKLWRIRDPRGFQLEISADCMTELIMNGTIINGKIQGKCVWHTGKILRYA